MAKMRVVLVGPAVQGAPGKTEELDPIIVAADGDQAKRAGRVALEDMGFTVRSLSWSPGANGAVDLLAYVTKGA